jgi:hypothetical protein
MFQPTSAYTSFSYRVSLEGILKQVIIVHLALKDRLEKLTFCTTDNTLYVVHHLVQIPQHKNRNIMDSSLSYNYVQGVSTNETYTIEITKHRYHPLYSRFKTPLLKQEKTHHHKIIVVIAIVRSAKVDMLL